jgi:hypothetical protein
MAMTRGLARGAVVAAVALTSIGAGLPARATSYFASNGARCTIVGTTGNDVLRGTPAHDVICGRGGNDTIFGGGGADTIDGGYGSDRLYGGPGNDTVYGGYGSDRLDGGPGNNVLQGGPGNDVLDGGYDSDLEHGGGGNDTLRGFAGNDKLYGDAGSDDLDGGDGVDLNNGGTDVNYCTLDGVDVPLVNCKYDTEAPSAVNVVVTPSVVDVSDGPATITVTFTGLDDTGIRLAYLASEHVELFRGAEQPLTGTVRNGVWRATGVVSRYSPAGDNDVGIQLTDRVGRFGGGDGQFSIVDNNPDVSPPKVLALSASPSTVDTRTAAGSVTVRAHITDVGSGVSAGHLGFCPYAPSDPPSQGSCAWAGSTPASGTINDGWWVATVPLPRGSLSGTWEFAVWVSDRANPSSPQYWDPPDLYQRFCPDASTCDPSYQELPAGEGQFTVLGVNDPEPPVVKGFRVSQRSVDSVPASTTLTFEVDAQDPDGDGVTGVEVDLYSTGSSPDTGPKVYSSWVRTPAVGTEANGTWQVPLTVPQGMPPGKYLAFLEFTDTSHYRYASPPNPDGTAVNPPTQELGPTEMGDWDGTVTIVDDNAPAP